MDNVQPVQTQLKLPGNLSYLNLALSFIDYSAQRLKFTTEELSRIRLAAEEAITNIMEYGFSNAIHESFTITCEAHPAHFKIIIHEKGKPFEPERVEKYDPDNLSLESDTNGLGLFLMKKMMDEISFHNLGRNGKQTVMVKYPEKERIDHCSEIEKPDNAASVAQENLFRMRDFSDKDAIGISQCAYLAYGYSYEAYIYYPSKIREMNRAGTMRSFVAQSNGNKVVGHMALKFDNNPNCAEMGVGVVSPEFRGKQIFDSLLAYALDRAKTMIELKSIYSRCVSSHPYSQKVALKSNFSPTGIQLALFPADVDFKSLSGKVNQKDSAVVITLNTTSNEPAQFVYLPENHKTVVQKIFERLKLDVAWKPPIPPEDEPTDEVVLNSSIMEVFNTGDIYCLSYNSQTIHGIRQSLRRLCLEKLDVIYLHLDMTHPSMPHVADQCEKLGFFFSNVLPFGTNGNHALVYQYLNNLNIDFDLIQVADTFSQFLKNYIANCYQQNILQ